MHSYELTERGKIAVAIILVLILLLIPAAILSIMAWASQPVEPPDDSSVIPPDNPTTDVINGPLPTDGSGFDPPPPTEPDPEPPSGPDTAPPTEPDTPPPTDEDPYIDKPGESSAPEIPGGVETTDPPEYGLIGTDSSKGTLSFLFSPSLQDDIDEETLAAITEFLRSPLNNTARLIQIEIKNTRNVPTETLVSAMIRVFASHGIPQERLTFVSHQAGATGTSLEVNLSYVPVNRPK